MTQAPAEARARALQGQGRFADAAEAWAAIPQSELSLGGAASLGYCLTRLGRLDAAQRWLDELRARTSAPQVRRLRLELANGFLAAGRYREGFALWEERIGLDPARIPELELGFPHWRGEPLEGRRFLVWPEQGFGDQIMMARFCAELAARGARVTLACRPELARILATAPGVTEVLAVPRGAPVRIPPHDVWARAFSLPHLLGATAQTIPAPPYLSVLAATSRPPAAARIGLAWRTSAPKALPDALARELLALGMTSLHPEDTGAADFAETAALMAGLDLVISVDTAAAHLAGALGRPVWVLLNAEPDWRWAPGPSPWYPAGRQFRAPRRDAWADVARQVTQALG